MARSSADSTSFRPTVWSARRQCRSGQDRERSGTRSRSWARAVPAEIGLEAEGPQVGPGSDRRVRHLRGEETLRHATLRAVVDPDTLVARRAGRSPARRLGVKPAAAKAWP